MKTIALVVLLELMAVSQAARCDGSPGSADGQCCFACEILINELIHEDASNQIHNADEAKAVLDLSCEGIGLFFEETATCKKWVDANYVAIYAQVDGAVKNHTTPHAHTICVNINECPSQRKIAGKGFECVICVMLFSVVETKIPQDGQLTEEELKELMKEACDSLGQFSPICYELITDAVVKAAFEYIEAEGTNYDPNELCNHAGLCP